MKLDKIKLIAVFALIGLISFFAFTFSENKLKNDTISFHIVDLEKQDLQLFWKDNKEKNFKTFRNLKNWLNSNSKELVFAMNAGMFKKDLSPQGLYIENRIIKSKIDTILKGYGNFYMQPNGVFYITNNKQAVICKTNNFTNENVKYATQSGPLLLIDGAIHSRFRKDSQNLNIRNGVGVLPNGDIIFAMSKQKINFYNFANYFKSLGCKNALYLDGFVSKMYLPGKEHTDLDTEFGVLVAETK